MISPKFFDHTILTQDAQKADIQRICNEAVQYGFASVCVNSYYTARVKEALKDSGVKVCTVVGFPLGMCMTSVKVFEAAEAVKAGADEIDMVMNDGALKDGDNESVINDIRAVREACDQAAEKMQRKTPVVLKVIIETCLLDDAQKALACQLACEGGADFVKTSTGFSKGGAQADDVILMKAMVGDHAKVKASGGIRDAKTAQEMIEAGADRLGTSATVAIIKESEQS